MQNDLLTEAAALCDRELLARLPLLARAERQASAELVAHLAELDARPRLYAGEGHGSLFAYCTRALRLSEDAACNRIEAARACRRFPQVLELLASGALSLTAIRLLGRHLTPENHASVLARATNRTRREIETLVAELAPRPDAPTLVRRLPAPADAVTSPARAVRPLETTTPPSPPPDQAAVATRRPAIAPLAPERFRVQFTLGPEAHARLRTLQQLLRREIPSGDVAQIVDRALVLLLEKVESRKLGATRRPRAQATCPATDEDAAEAPLPARRPSNAVRRAVWNRDGGQCAFVSRSGLRCEERTFLEFHHQRPYALRGNATADNMALRCRRHNQYEAEMVFGGAAPEPAVSVPGRITRGP